jgi:pimeloyl-ACP methyl ester carboxylesterase
VRRAGTAVLVLCLIGAAWTYSQPRGAAASSTGCETAELKPFGGVLKAQTIPVLFVHGITGDPSIFTDRGLDGAASIAAQVRAIPGTSVWTFNYHKVSLDWVTNKQIGSALATSISCLARVSRKRVVVIAHSMGGLATQYAAAQHDPQGGTEGERLAHVFAIATPFKGSKLLSAAQNAIRGAGDEDPATTAAIDALLSECAGVGERAYAANNQDPCGILSVLHSPVGTSLEFNSPAIAALPHWSPSVPVTDIAGNVDLDVGVWKLRHTFDIGDVAVSRDSATAHNTSDAPIEVTCHDALRRLLKTPCYHSRLPRNANIVPALVKDVREVVAVERATFAPPIYGGLQWRDYFPVRIGRQCTLTTSVHLGDITSEATQTQTTTSAGFQAQGVYFVIHAVTAAHAPGSSVTNTLTIPYLLANDGTLQAAPGLTDNSQLKYTYKGFEVYPSIQELQHGKTRTSTVSITISGRTAEMTKLLAQATHGSPTITINLMFKVGSAPARSTITTPAGTFTHPVGVEITGIKERAPSQSSSTNSAIDTLIEAFVGKRIIVYFGRGTGPILNENLGGLFGPTTVRLTGCRG